MKELKLKLDRGHSITDIEEHLKNAADLVGGEQIPTSWSSVLKECVHHMIILFSWGPGRSTQLVVSVESGGKTV